jgi:hypothetical protein
MKCQQFGLDFCKECFRVFRLGIFVDPVPKFSLCIVKVPLNPVIKSVKGHLATSYTI